MGGRVVHSDRIHIREKSVTMQIYSAQHEHGTRAGDNLRAMMDLRLSGWRLAAARMVVAVISAVTVGLGIYALVLWPRLATPCADATNS